MCHSHKINEYLLSRPDEDDLVPVAVSADISTLKWGRDEYADDQPRSMASITRMRPRRITRPRPCFTKRRTATW